MDSIFKVHINAISICVGAQINASLTVENVAYTLSNTASKYSNTQNTIKREGNKIIINLSLDLTNAQGSDHLVKFDKALAPSGRIDIPVLCGNEVLPYSINSDANETFIKCNHNNQTYRATIIVLYILLVSTVKTSILD